MELTRIDCDISYRELSDSSTFSVFNPGARPGTLVAGFSSAPREAVSSKVASRLAIQRYVEAITDFFWEAAPASLQEDERDQNLEALERAFREANKSVYEFGHQLVAGGRMVASLFGIVISNKVVAAGKSDSGAAYMFRDGKLAPFFVEEAQSSLTGSLNFVGASSMLNVELSSIKLQESDIIVALSETPDAETESRLVDICLDGVLQSEDAAEKISRRLYSQSYFPVVMVVTVGPGVIYLKEAL
ncbi:MAG: hypothetical protein D6808_07925 [Candidatus Dadabacteria bacterium]|nr:MAG: hypothetical protein D6808_07925 [Candidatus Dadabacteria bacterium]